MSSLQAVVELVDKMSGPLSTLTKNVSDFAKGVLDGAKAELELQKNGKEAAKGQDNLSASLKEVGKALLGLKVAKEVFDAFGRSIEAADKMDELSGKTGIAASELQGYAHAAEMSDTSLEGMISGLNKLNRSMAASEEETSKQAAAFDALGISTTNADGTLKSSEQTFGEIADKFQGLKDGPEKAALAFAIFGQAGKDLIPMLNQGSEGIKALREEATVLGQMGPDSFDAFTSSAGSMYDGVHKVRQIFEGLVNVINAEVVPVFNVLIDEFIESFKQGGLVADIFEALKVVAIGAFIPAFKSVIVVIRGVTDVVSLAGKGLGALGAIVAAVASGDIAGAKAVWQSYKEDVAKTADEHVKFTDKLWDSSNASDVVNKSLGKTGDTALANAPKIKKLGSAAKELKSDLEAMVVSLKNSNDSFGMDDSVKQRLEAYQKYQKDIKAGINPEKAQSLLNEAQAQITLNEQLRAGKEANEAYKKAQTSIADDELKVQILELEATMVGKSKSERDAAVQILLDEAEVRKITNGLTGDSKTKIEEEIKALNQRREAAKGRISDEEKLQSLVSGTLVEQEKKARDDIAYLSDAYSTGRIKSEDEYVQAVLLRLSQVKDATKTTTDEMTVFWQEAAKGMQSSMSTFFFDIMEGNTTDLAASFKKMLDKMVADALAANLADALFGSSFTKTGSSSGGLISTGINWLSGLFSGARATGGSVNANEAYLVGENGPEPFIPSVSGTILPNSSLSSLSGSGGSQVNISISAMDSQDVRRALEKDNRWLADLVNKSNRAYNLSGA